MPSRGLGGGIERYMEGVIAALEEGGDEVRIVAMLTSSARRPNAVAKVSFLWEAAKATVKLRMQRRGAALIIGCPAFASIGAILSLVSGRQGSGRFLFAYGQEVWHLPLALRLWVALGNFELVTISDFTAGALVGIGNAAVLPPGLTAEWYSTLLTAGRDRERSGDEPLSVLSVFRLDDAVAKGLPRILAAIDALDPEAGRLRLTVAGSGTLPEVIGTAILDLDRVDVVGAPSDGDLAKLYAAADIVVLATPVETDRAKLSGEGFGIVLVEAQLAGAMVIAPAHGGSAGAFLEGITGLRPIDESSDELCRILTWCLRHREAVASMGDQGRAWSSVRFDPMSYRRRVRRVLGVGADRFGSDMDPAASLTLEVRRDDGLR